VGLTILVVEDNSDSMALIEYLFRANGYVPLLARSGEEGVEIALRERPDLILLDIRLPGMDGYQVAAVLKQRPELARTRIVAVTASVTASDQERIAAAGLDGYIAKPIEPEWFMEQLEPFLSEAATGPTPSEP
jgi:CheY-like chemotaxis protein